jgi:mRNA interferase MazF
MKRGEVWWVNFDPSIGGEIQKRRPAIIVSNDASNRHLKRLHVVPLTTNVQRLYPNEAYVMLGNRQLKAMADQIATVSKLRILDQEGAISSADLRQVERAIRIQLGLT